MTVHVHVAHYHIQEITVYAESGKELQTWINSWQATNQNQVHRIIPLDNLSAVVQARKPR